MKPSFVAGGVTAGVMALAMLTPCHGALVPIASASASTQWPGLDPVRTYNSSGIAGGMATEGQVSLATHENNGSAGTMWHSQVVAAAGQWLVWGFSAPSNLRTIYYWNHNQSGLTDRGIQDVNIKISKDNGATYTSLGDFVLIRASGAGNERCQILELPATQTGVTNVKFDIASNFGGNVVGFSEIRFSDVPVLPPDPTVDFSATPAIVLNQDRQSSSRVPSNLEWASTNLSALTISPGVGSVDVEGVQEVTPPVNADTVYTLSGQGGSAQTFSYTTTIRSVAGGSSSFRYVRFTPVKLRNTAGANSIQLSELEFYDASGNLILPAGATNPGGNNPANQGPGAAVDGSTSTKWLDFNKGPLVVDFGAGAPAFVDYQLVTGEDEPPRDPVRWLLEGSNDQTTWTLIDNVTSFDYPIPLARPVVTPMIPLPGSSLQAYSTFTGDATVLPLGDLLTLTWKTLGATSVSISPGIGNVPVNGSVRLSPMANTTYTLTATTAAGKAVTSTFSVQVSDFPIKTIAYANFNSSAGELSLLGGAAVLSDARATSDPTAAKRLRINPDTSGVSGTAWFRKRQNVVNGFESTFALNFLNFAADPLGGADGIAFVIQNSAAGATALPDSFPERGVSSNALNITFDSYKNDDEESSATLQIRKGSDMVMRVDLAAVPGIVLTKAGDLTQTDLSAAPYQVRVVYAPGDLDVYVNGILVVDSFGVNLSEIGAVDDEGSAYAGFTARTGGAYESHDVTAWTLTSGTATTTTPLKITGYTMNPATGALSLTWSSTSGKSYRIAASSNLSTWTTVLKNGIAATAGSTTSSTTFTPETVRFFRVEEE